MKEPIYYVYLITNTILNKCYVGMRITYDDPNLDQYFGSCKYLNDDIFEYGKRNFIKKVLEIYKTEEEMMDGEHHNILKYNAMVPTGYNHWLPPLGRKSTANHKRSLIKDKLKNENKLPKRISYRHVLNEIKNSNNKKYLVSIYEKKKYKRLKSLADKIGYGKKPKEGWPWEIDPNWELENWAYIEMEKIEKKIIKQNEIMKKIYNEKNKKIDDEIKNLINLYCNIQSV